MWATNTHRPRSCDRFLTVVVVAVVVVAGTCLTKVVAAPSYSPCIRPMDAKCDTRSRLSDKIIGGQIAEPGSTPWLVSLQDTHYDVPVPFCGGTLLSHSWVLTAATCVFSYQHNYASIEVVVGEYDMEETDGFEKYRRVNLIMLHPEYDIYTYHADVALLRLSLFVLYNERIGVLKLPVWKDKNSEEQEEEEEGDVMFLHDHGGHHGNGHDQNELYTIAGWGRVGESGDPSPVVRMAEIPLVNQEECQAVYSVLTSTMICAGNLTHGGLDACQGDMGGPLATSDGYIKGVSSFRVGCGRPGYPGVYTDVAQVVDWICSVTDKWTAHNRLESC